jgi:hypothetical protein
VSCRLGRGKPYFWTTESCAGYYSYTWGKYKSFLLTRTLESLAGISSLIMDFDWGKPLPWSMEPQERLSTYARWIGRGKPLLEYLEHNAGRNPLPTLNIQLWESIGDVPENSFCTLVKAMVFTITLTINPTFLGNLVSVKFQAPFFLYIVPSPNYYFWKH